MKTKFFILALAMCIATPAFGADEKIDPATYICAELIAANLDGQPPIYEGLQLDGYYASKNGETGADAGILAPMLMEVSDSCASRPADKAIEHWKMARKNNPAGESSWRADKTTCGDYAANPDDGSGFVIWLDAYNRGKTGKDASILSSQEVLDHFLEVCKANPEKLMLDVIHDNAR